MKLAKLGEDELVRRIARQLRRNRHVVVGAGDDCAVMRFRGSRDFLLLKIDSLVENVHFSLGENPRAVGCKAMMRVLSDFAAMSGVPEFALVTLIISGDREIQWVRQLYSGLVSAASRFHVAIVGGETSSTRGPTAIVVSASGYVERSRCVLRSGGKGGDDLFVTGRLGGALGGRHLRFVPRIDEARWLTANFQIHAMMDLSDGLGSDLPRLARASQVGFEIERNSLPVTRGCTVNQAISDGEDYELLFAVAPKDSERLQRRWRKKFPRLQLTRIGKFTRHSSLGARHVAKGYVHFTQRR